MSRCAAIVTRGALVLFTLSTSMTAQEAAKDPAQWLADARAVLETGDGYVFAGKYVFDSKELPIKGVFVAPDNVHLEAEGKEILMKQDQVWARMAEPGGAKKPGNWGKVNLDALKSQPGTSTELAYKPDPVFLLPPHKELEPVLRGLSDLSLGAEDVDGVACAVVSGRLVPQAVSTMVGDFSRHTNGWKPGLAQMCDVRTGAGTAKIWIAKATCRGLKAEIAFSLGGRSSGSLGAAPKATGGSVKVDLALTLSGHDDPASAMPIEARKTLGVKPPKKR